MGDIIHADFGEEKKKDFKVNDPHPELHLSNDERIALREKMILVDQATVDISTLEPERYKRMEDNVSRTKLVILYNEIIRAGETEYSVTRPAYFRAVYERLLEELF